MNKQTFSFKLLTLLFLMIAITASAFTFMKTTESTKKRVDQDWLYQPQPGSTNLTDPQNYVSGAVATCPSGTANICGIKAPADGTGDHPDIAAVSGLSGRINDKDTDMEDVFLKN